MVAGRRAVIIGAGLAGSRCAFALRAAGYDGDIALVGDEPHAPYDRPPLSKSFLLGRRDASDLTLRALDDYSAAGIELILSQPVRSVNVRSKRVSLYGGTDLDYTSLVFATGARPRTLPSLGPLRRGVQVLRTIEDALELRSTARPGARVVIIGAGLIGSEVASTLTSSGVHVLVIDPERLPMRRVLGDVVGSRMHRQHLDAGVQFRLGTLPTQLIGTKRVIGVRLDSGEEIVCDHVVIGIGAIPRTELAIDAGLPVRSGILAESCGQTAVPGVYAVGDVAETFVRHLDQHAHVEHWQAADRQAVAAAHHIAGVDSKPDEVPWFWSDQFGIQLQAVGWPDPGARTIVRGNLDELNFVAFQVRDERVVAAVGCARGRELRRAATLVRTGARIDGALLADESIDIRDLQPVA